MPVVLKPGSLTYLIETPVGSVVVPQDVREALNDLFLAWGALDVQLGEVMRRRLNRATRFRALYDDAVRL